MRAKTINEYLNQENINILSITNSIKNIMGLSDDDLKIYNEEIQVIDYDYGPEETTLVLDISLQNNYIIGQWRAEDANSENHIDYAFGSFKTNSLKQFEKEIKNISKQVRNRYEEYLMSDDYEDYYDQDDE